MIGDLKQRVHRLEQGRKEDGHKCLDCGMRAEDIREILITLLPAACPTSELINVLSRAPEDDLCGRCRRPKMVRIIESRPPDESVIDEPHDTYRHVPLMTVNGRGA
jgi:hypothetical protein